MSSELKACPFCGGEEGVHPSETWREVYKVIYHNEGCYICDSKPPYNFTLHDPEENIAWNTRHQSEEEK